MVTVIDNIYASKGLYQELLGPVCRKYDLTDSEVIILLFLAEKEDVTATDIVLSRRLKKSVVSVSLKDLHDRGLIESRYLDGNRRSVHLKVTDDADEIIAEARNVQDEYYEILTEGLSREEKNSLKACLKKVNENIRKYRK